MTNPQWQYGRAKTNKDQSSLSASNAGQACVHRSDQQMSGIWLLVSTASSDVAAAELQASLSK